MARRKPEPTRRERLGTLFHSPLGRTLVRVTLGALVFLLTGIVMRQARAYAYSLEAFRVHRERVEFVELPRWADAQVQWALQPRMFRRLSVSIYDPDAEDVLRAHVTRHPLIRDAQDIRVLYPDRALVHAQLRVPVAQVAVWVDKPGRRQARRWRLLSDDGCLLPRKPYKSYIEHLPYALPIVTGITEPVPHDPGEVWEDGSGRVQEAVSAAMLAGRIYRSFRGRVSVLRVDVSRFPNVGGDRMAGEVRLVLSCPPEVAGGKRVQRTIEWGRTERARADVPYEDGYLQKFERLRRILIAPRPPGFIDVRFDGAPRSRRAQGS